MEILILLVFASLMLVAAALVFFVWMVRKGTFEHSERMELLPLEDDENELVDRL